MRKLIKNYNNGIMTILYFIDIWSFSTFNTVTLYPYRGKMVGRIADKMGKL